MHRLKERGQGFVEYSLIMLLVALAVIVILAISGSTNRKLIQHDHSSDLTIISTTVQAAAIMAACII